ncbi:protein kinase domain-containing protein [Sorangium sp. So ce406]|uniref:serine/threonine-protein kinase n=1 Tax=Sorangium sp. So ce406 TaxID=3133311 RepID=UPI003F5BA8FA
MRPQAGQVINNKYRLVRVIGDGGMGSVYEARHEVLGTTVALKFLHPELSRRSGLVQRFLQEARVSAQIQSAHVVRVVDVDQTTSGLAFIVMEYLEGKTLQALYEELYRAGVRLAYADALEYAMQMLEGVEAAHRAGVVHRDLKPDNVIITRTSKGEPLIKLLDFGIAKLKVTGELDRGLTRPGVIMGTPEYMAPEQAYSADSVDARADIFSLGVIIFEMLAGRRPVGGDEPQQIAGAYLSGQISRLSDLAPEIAPALCAAVHRAMAASPPDRFATTAEFRSALEPFARAARAPSALTPSPSEVSLARSSASALPAALAAPGVASPSALAPATNPMGDGRISAVPKTIPPEDDGAQRAVSGPPGAPGASTPMGGFSSDARGPSASAPGFTPRPEPSSGPYFAHGGYPPVGQPATVNAAPYMPPHGMPGVPATSHEPGPFDVSPRPGGTAVGNAPPFMGRSSAAPAGAFNGGPAPGYGGPYGGGPQGYIPGTAPMEPLPGTTHGGSAHRAQPPRRGTSVFTILLLATGITGAVVGGLYIANEVNRGRQADAVPTMPTLQPAITVPSDPGPATTTPPATTPPAVTSPAVEPPPVVAKPQPRPPSTTTSKPPTTPSATGTQTPPTRPSGTTIIPTLPPLVIPSTFPPFPFPGSTSAQPPTNPPTTTTPSPPTTSPPTPTTPTTPSERPRRRVIIVPNN